MLTNTAFGKLICVFGKLQFKFCAFGTCLTHACLERGCCRLPISCKTPKKSASLDARAAQRFHDQGLICAAISQGTAKLRPLCCVRGCHGVQAKKLLL